MGQRQNLLDKHKDIQMTVENAKVLEANIAYYANVKRQLIRAHREGIITGNLALAWTADTQVVFDQTGVQVPTLVQDLMVQYSKDRELSVSDFKSNTEILYRCIVALAKAINDIDESGKITLTTLFATYPSMFGYSDLVAMYNKGREDVQ